MRRVFGHASQLFSQVMDAFLEEHVPAEALVVLHPAGAVGHDLGASWRPGRAGRPPGAAGATSNLPTFHAVPNGDLLVDGLAAGAQPGAGHDLARQQPVPAFAAEWFAGYERGVDVVLLVRAGGVRAMAGPCSADFEQMAARLGGIDRAAAHPVLTVRNPAGLENWTLLCSERP